MIGMLSISFGMLGTLPLASPFLGGVWVVSVQPVVAGPLVPRPKELTVCSLSFAVFFFSSSKYSYHYVEMGVSKSSEFPCFESLFLHYLLRYLSNFKIIDFMQSFCQSLGLDL